VAGQPGSALVEGQQALLRVEGLVLHRHGAEGAIRQAGDQGFTVSGTPEGGHHSPALGGGIQAAAVGQKVPDWAQTAYDDYAKRFPPDLRLELKAVKAEPRSSKTAEQLMAAESVRLEAAIPKGARRVVLDERGTRLTTMQLSQRLSTWVMDGRDVALIVGGPDGRAASLKDSAEETLRLSDLTLPHAYVRVLLAEALYRAWTVTINHPYHRE
jgi:23S rRNA (pseudouridine1915-N3)-methyltransferase